MILHFSPFDKCTTTTSSSSMNSLSCKRRGIVLHCSNIAHDALLKYPSCRLTKQMEFKLKLTNRFRKNVGYAKCVDLCIESSDLKHPNSLVSWKLCTILCSESSKNLKHPTLEINVGMQILVQTSMSQNRVQILNNHFQESFMSILDLCQQTEDVFKCT